MASASTETEEKKTHFNIICRGADAIRVEIDSLHLLAQESDYLREKLKKAKARKLLFMKVTVNKKLMTIIVDYCLYKKTLSADTVNFQQLINVITVCHELGIDSFWISCYIILVDRFLNLNTFQFILSLVDQFDKRKKCLCKENSEKFARFVNYCFEEIAEHEKLRMVTPSAMFALLKMADKTKHEELMVKCVEVWQNVCHSSRSEKAAEFLKMIEIDKFTCNYCAL